MDRHGGMLAVSLTRADLLRLGGLHAELAPEWTRPTELTHLKTAGLLNSLTLLALQRSGYQPRPRTRNLDESRVEQALYWYRQNLNQQPSVGMVSSAVGVSEVHLRRLFHAVRGESPKAAFQRMRMEAVRQSLDNPQLTVDEAAGQHGFADASSLTRAYRKEFGVTPRASTRGRRPYYSGGKESSAQH